MDNWQDWNVVQWKKPPSKLNGGGEVVSRDRHAESQVHKLDQVTDAEHVVHCSMELRKQIQIARLAKKMSQSQLAQLTNEKPSVIQQYESGKAVPTSQILQKLRKALGVKLKSK